MLSMTASPHFNLVLGRWPQGLNHIGALRALEERGLVPQRSSGSMGALVAAAWASMAVSRMEERALKSSAATCSGSPTLKWP